MESNKDIIKHILENPIRLRESYIFNNFIKFYDKVIEFNILNQLPTDISFKEKLWYYINDIRTEKLCLLCDNKVKFNKKFTNGYKNYCSAKCTQQNIETKEKRKKTCNSKYGVDNVAKLYENKIKAANSNMMLYGFKSSFQNKEVRLKWSNNIKKKYDVEHIFQLDWVREKSKETSLDRYGVEHYVQSENYKSKLKEIGHSDNMKIVYNTKTIKTNLKRYGVEHYIQSEEYKSKMSDSNMVLYLKEKTFERRKGSFNYNGYELLPPSNGNNIQVKSNICGHVFETFYECFVDRYNNNHNCCLICLPLHSISVSSLELEIRDFLDNMNINYIPNYNNYNIEMDIYIPNLNIAIEMNGLYWHSELKKHKRFHLKKTEICKSNGINLMHIWEDDWLYKKEIVKSIIKNKLGMTNNKIYARKCIIKELNTKEAKLFINSNHIQGYSGSSVKLGLYHNNVLVSAMTFGNRYTNGKKENELIRYCNLLNTSVLGGASKLFKYYINNYDLDTIKSYADVSMFSGELYEILGFNYIHRSSPNYYWVVNGIRKHRFKYNKKKLIQDGYESNRSETEIMHGRGYYRIWGCGQDLYKFNKLK